MKLLKQIWRWKKKLESIVELKTQWWVGEKWKSLLNKTSLEWWWNGTGTEFANLSIHRWLIKYLYGRVGVWERESQSTQNFATKFRHSMQKYLKNISWGQWVCQWLIKAIQCSYTYKGRGWKQWKGKLNNSKYSESLK